MLFSEPKIPQLRNRQRRCAARRLFQCSSASRKFLNSPLDNRASVRYTVFQCSSASRKFLNFRLRQRRAPHRVGFSALQRAENSSISTDRSPARTVLAVSVLFSEPKIPQLLAALPEKVAEVVFQCSSASRKFLNSAGAQSNRHASRCFSALQRAENSSIRQRRAGACRPQRSVSVLFSEPKIPQLHHHTPKRPFCQGFSALQRAENSSISRRWQATR